MACRSNPLADSASQRRQTANGPRLASALSRAMLGGSTTRRRDSRTCPEVSRRCEFYPGNSEHDLGALAPAQGGAHSSTLEHDARATRRAQGWGVSVREVGLAGWLATRVTDRRRGYAHSGCPVWNRQWWPSRLGRQRTRCAVPQDECYVYMWSDTHGVVRYIGRGALGRITDHGSDDPNADLALAFREFGPLVPEVLRCPDPQSAALVEGALISAATRHRFNLTNRRLDTAQFVNDGLELTPCRRIGIDPPAGSSWSTCRGPWRGARGGLGCGMTLRPG